MLKAEQIPWQAKEQLGRWLASGASHEECIAAVINAWPGAHKWDTGQVWHQAAIVLPLTENNNGSD